MDLGTSQLRGRHARDAVRAAFAACYRHIDAATMYGNEEDLGQVIRASGLFEHYVLSSSLRMPNACRKPARAVRTTRSIRLCSAVYKTAALPTELHRRGRAEC